MTRRIPIFEFNEELSSKKPQVYKSLIEGVSEAIKQDKKEINWLDNKTIKNVSCVDFSDFHCSVCDNTEMFFPKWL